MRRTKIITARHRAVALMAAIALTVAAAPTTLAETTGTVVGTVTAAESGACLLVGATSVDFGAHPFNAPGGDVIEGEFDGGAGTTFSLESCAAVDQEVLARGTDATSQTSAASWTLGDSGVGFCPDPNVYKMYVFLDTGTGTDSTDVYTTDSALPWQFTPATQLTTGLWMHMPCTGSDGAGEVFDFQVLYTAITI